MVTVAPSRVEHVLTSMDVDVQEFDLIKRDYVYFKDFQVIHVGLMSTHDIWKFVINFIC